VKIRIQGVEISEGLLISPATKEIIRVASNLPDGDLMPKYSMASKIKKSIGTIDAVAAHPAAAPYRVVFKQKLYFCNKATKKEVEKLKQHATY
jgi:hypothetical protein